VDRLHVPIWRLAEPLDAGADYRRRWLCLEAGHNFQNGGDHGGRL